MGGAPLKKFLLLVLISLSFPFLWKEWTQGFRVAKLLSSFPTDSGRGLQLPLHLFSTLSQRFKYLAKGAQSFVFESEDGEYVVKFLRSGKEKKIERFFNACRLAYEELPEETGVVYLHLAQTGGTLPFFRGKDPLGRSFRLPLDSFYFIVQKKGESFEGALLRAKGDPDAMRRRFDQFFDLLERRTEKGIWNKDPSLKRNFGFLEDRAIELDFGSYRTVDRLDRKGEIERYSRKFRKWLVKHAPESVHSFDACLASRLSNLR